MPLVRVNGADLYHEVRGSGPALLFIAGAFSDTSHFARVGELLTDEFTIVTYDRRGYSRSGGGGGPTGPAAQADDAVNLLAALGLAPAAVYGNSSGAIIALDLVLRQAAAVQAAILHEPPLMAGWARPDEVRAAIGGVVERGMATGGPAAAAEAFFRFVAGDANWESIGHEARDRIRKNGPTFFGSEIGKFEPFRPDDAALAAISRPVLVLVSEGSPPFFAEATAWLAARLGVAITWTPGTHTPQIDHPVELAHTIRTFLREHARRS
jgi:pimeloyl-ACP methyl ester carboxylesterase